LSKLFYSGDFLVLFSKKRTKKGLCPKKAALKSLLSTLPYQAQEQSKKTCSSLT
jgi:hypothetical protein